MISLVISRIDDAKALNAVSFLKNILNSIFAMASTEQTGQPCYQKQKHKSIMVTLK